MLEEEMKHFLLRKLNKSLLFQNQMLEILQL